MAEPRGERALDDAAWRVLTDLMTPGGEFAALSPQGLQQLIQMRLEKEATRLGVPPEALGRAFERAMVELRGERAPSAEDQGDRGGQEEQEEREGPADPTA